MVILSPTTVEELSALVAGGGTILPTGQGSKLHWGPQVECDRTLSTKHLNKLIDHAVGDLTVTAESGMRLADLQAKLGEAGQFLAIDPSFPDQTTLGGLVATADSGSLRHRYGGVRDMLLGVTFVRSDGQIAKAGGRVVKNVAGYDLMKLMTGSYGTLGILTQMTFRVYPLPEVSRSLVVTGEGLGDLVQAIQAATLTPTSLDLVVGDLGFGAEMALVVRFQSIAAGVEAQMVQLEGLVGDRATQAVEADGDLWETIGGHCVAGAVVCKVGVPTPDAVAFADYVQSLGAELVFHAGVGLGRLVLPDNRSVVDVRKWLGDRKGFLTILSGAGDLEPWGYGGNALALMKVVKAQFDPGGILSPGRFVGGI